MVIVPGRRPGFPSGTQGYRYQQYGFSLTGHERDATGTQKAKDPATSQLNRKQDRSKASKLHTLKLATPSGGNGKLSSRPATNPKLAYYRLNS